MASTLPGRDQKVISSLTGGVNYTELNIRDEAGGFPLIRLEDDFVRMLEQHVLGDLKSGVDSVGGFLLGTEEGGAFRISGFQPLASAGLQSLQSVVNDGNPGKTSGNVVGLYRARRQANHSVSRDDLIMFRERFTSGRRIFLQVKPAGERLFTGVIYLGENGYLQADRRSVEWPVNLGELGAEEAQVSAAACKAKEQDAEKRLRRRGLWKWGLCSAVLTCAVVIFWSFRPVPQQKPAPESRALSEPAVQSRKRNARTAADRKPVAASVAQTAAAAGGAPPSLNSASNSAPPSPNSVPVHSARLPAPLSGKEAQPAELPAQVTKAPEPITPTPAPAAEKVENQTSTPAAAQSSAETGSLSVPAEAGNRPLEAPAPRLPEVRPRAAPSPEVSSGLVPAAGQWAAPPRPSLQVTPAVSPVIMRGIQGFMIVSVRVDVDEAGKVISAVPVSNASGVHNLLASAVVDAVRRWQFEPARQGGQAVRGETVLHFKYVNE